MRLLGVIRLSKETDETTSPERQKLAIEHWAAEKGHRIIDWAVDLDVSGKVAPDKRPGLGPWMKRMDQWDALIGHKPDRISRNLRDFLNLWHELDEHGKTLISVDPEFDLSTPIGRLVAQILLIFAQYEIEVDSDRVKGTYRYIKVNGGYPGGQVPFGYRPVERGKGWTYEHDPVYAPIVREMVDRILSGQSMSQVASWLNESDVPTSRNVVRRRKGIKQERVSEWSANQVKAILRYPTIYGVMTQDGKPLRDDDGNPIQRCDGIITRQEWERVGRAIAGPTRKTVRRDANPFLGIVYCFECGSPYYPARTVTGGRVYEYYRCSKVAVGKCRAKMIRAEGLAKLVELVFLALVGKIEWGHFVTHAAEDHTWELAEVQQLTDEIVAEYTAGGLDIEKYKRQIKSLDARRDALLALPSRPESEEFVGHGITYGEHFTGLSEADRAADMREAEFKLYVSHTDATPPWKAGFHVKDYFIQKARLGQPVAGVYPAALKAVPAATRETGNPDVPWMIKLPADSAEQMASMLADLEAVFGKIGELPAEAEGS